MENNNISQKETPNTQNDTQNMPAQQTQFNLKQQAYEDTKQAIRDFENNHPGAGRKIVGLSLIAAGAIVLSV